MRDFLLLLEITATEDDGRDVDQTGKLQCTMRIGGVVQGEGPAR